MGLILPATLLLLLLLASRPATAQQQDSTDSLHDGAAGDEEAAEPKLNLDPAALRDAIASLLRDGVAVDGENDGYAEAAQEYLEHVQSLLAAAKSPSEVYIREQLADLETLNAVLAGLEAGGHLNPSAGARLVGQLVKGPARELILLTAEGTIMGREPATSFAFPAVYAGSELAARVTDAVAELRRFLDSVSGASLTDELRRHSDGVPAGRTRDYLDAVLDRVLELDGKKVKFNVKFPEAGGDGLGEARVTRAPDDDDEDDSQQATTSSNADGGGGRSLFDQVLSRRAAASVAARLAEGGPAEAAARIGELRGRRYQPAGMAVILEAIEQCLKQG